MVSALSPTPCSQLGGHKNLGIHTEIAADGVLPLVEKGVVNGEAKKTDPGKMVSTFLMGSQRVYDFIDDNPGVLMMDGVTQRSLRHFAERPFRGHQLGPQIDLTGQVCADSLGTKFGPGRGRSDRLRLRRLVSKGGKAIIAMPSITNKGVSEDPPDAAGRRRRGDHPQPHPLVRHGVRCRGSLRQRRCRSVRAAHLDRPPLGIGRSSTAQRSSAGVRTTTT